jgi:hypothetical protein
MPHYDSTSNLHGGPWGSHFGLNKNSGLEVDMVPAQGKADGEVDDACLLIAAACCWVVLAYDRRQCQRHDAGQEVRLRFTVDQVAYVGWQRRVDGGGYC